MQGITGSSGAFHARGCMEYGTNVVAGVTPGKGKQSFDGKVPIYDTVSEARKQTGCNATMIFVPAPFAADAILEAADAGVELIVCITEGIPVMDMMRVKEVLKGSKSRLIGPNCPGIITPVNAKSVSCRGTFISAVTSVLFPGPVLLLMRRCGNSRNEGTGNRPVSVLVGTQSMELRIWTQ